MWKLHFILPNLNINKAIENNYIAIVPADDSRIGEIVLQNKYAKALVENFQDQFRRTRKPSFLIINNSALKVFKQKGTIIGFRNIVALAMIIQGYEHILRNHWAIFPMYSDYFNFYPITVSKKDDGFITWSPSILGFDNENEQFIGQTTPSLSKIEYVQVNQLCFLFDLLHKAWHHRYIHKKNDEWSTRVLFRSLEMAYRASAMPFQNHATIDDYGTSASLWVSAFEILSHPKNKNANLLTVIDLLKKYKWHDKALEKRVYRIKRRNDTIQVNLSQKLYKELYDTRNDFLHGNSITKKRINLFKRKDTYPITYYAPLLYKVALSNYLAQYKEDTNDIFSSEKIQRRWDEIDFCKALLKAKKSIASK